MAYDHLVLEWMLQLVNFWGVFLPFCEKILKKNSITNSYSLKFFFPKIKKTKKTQKLSQLPNNMKGCLRFYIFVFLIPPKSAKYTCGPLPLKSNITKLKKKNINHNM
jgi:hypothetical protein